MTWRRLWLRLIRRTFSAYLGYPLVVAISTAIFLMSLALMQGVKTQLSVYSQRIHSNFDNFIPNVLFVLLGIILVFAFFFIVYFHRLLLRRESPALGLLSTLGMAPSSRYALVCWESVWLGGIGIALGLALGIVLLPLFLMIASVMLLLPERVTISLHASTLVTTAMLFGILILLEGIFSAWQVGRRWPRQLLAATRTVEVVRRPQAKQAILGILSLVTAYSLAGLIHPWVLHHITPSLAVILWPALMAVIVMLCCLGTYWLIAESLRWWIRRNTTARGYDAVGLVSRARLAARLQSHAGSGTLIAALVAAVVGTASMLVSTQVQAFTHALQQNPVTVEFVTQGIDSQKLDQVTNQFVAMLQQKGFGPVRSIRYQTVLAAAPLQGIDERGLAAYQEDGGWYGDRIRGVTLMSRSAYLALVQEIQRTHGRRAGTFPTVPVLRPGQTFAIRTDMGTKATVPLSTQDLERTETTRWLTPGHTYPVYPVDLTEPAPEPSILANLPSLQLSIVGAGATPGAIVDSFGVNQTFFIVDDQTFATFATQAATISPALVATYNGLFYDRWQQSALVITRWLDQQEPPVGANLGFSSLPTQIQEITRYISALLFTLGLFAILSLLAAGAVIVFKLTEHVSADTRQVATLRQLGIGVRDIQRILRREAFTLLLAPFVPGLLHATFALLDWFGTMRSAGFEPDPLTQLTAAEVIGAIGFAMLVIVFVLSSIVTHHYGRQLWVNAQRRGLQLAG